MDGRTDGQKDPLIEMQSHLKKGKNGQLGSKLQKLQNPRKSFWEMTFGVCWFDKLVGLDHPYGGVPGVSMGKMGVTIFFIINQEKKIKKNDLKKNSPKSTEYH